MVTIQIISFDDGWDKLIFNSSEDEEQDLDRIDLRDLFEAIPA